MNAIFLIMVLPVIKMEYTKITLFNTSLRTLEGAHRKRQEKKRKGGKKEKLFQLCKKVTWIFTPIDCVSFQSMYKYRKEVFLFILNAGNFSLYLYPGIIVTFYFEHVYLENIHNRPFLFHLNWCLFEFSCFCSLGFMLCSLIFNLKWGRGTLANCSYTSPRKIPSSSVNTI